MSPSKTKNYAASVRQRLLNYARSNEQDFIFVLRTFAMERLLYRLSRSPYADSFVLKGAMLFKLWTGDFYRPTRDIDVLAFKSVTIFNQPSQTCLADLPTIRDSKQSMRIRQSFNRIRLGYCRLVRRHSTGLNP